MILRTKSEKWIFAGAFVARCLLLLFILFYAGPGLLSGFADGGWYVTLAQNLVDHHKFTSNSLNPDLPEGLRTPGYPLFLAIFLFFGFPLWIAVLVQILLTSFTPVLVMRIARRLELGARTEIFAGLLMAFEPSQVLYSTVILSDSLGAMAFTGFIYFLVVYWQDIGIKALVLSSVCLGLYNYIRRVGYYLVFLLPLLFVAGAAVAQKSLKKSVLAGLLLGGLAFLVFFPWQIRNYFAFGEFSISTIPSLYTAAAGGAYAAGNKIDIKQAQIELEERIKPLLADKESPLSPMNDPVYRREALKIISEYPAEYLKMYILSLNTFFTSGNYHEILARLGVIQRPSGGARSFSVILAGNSLKDSWSAFIDFIREPYGAVAFLGRLLLGPVFLMSLAGAVVLWFNKRGVRFFVMLYILNIAYFAAFVALVIEGIEARHRLQLNPLIFIFASYALHFFLGYFKGWNISTGASEDD